MSNGDPYKLLEMSADMCKRALFGHTFFNSILNIFKNHVNITIQCPFKKVRIPKNSILIQHFDSQKLLFQYTRVFINNVSVPANIFYRLPKVGRFQVQIISRGLFLGQKKMIQYRIDNIFGEISD